MSKKDRKEFCENCPYAPIIDKHLDERLSALEKLVDAKFEKVTVSTVLAAESLDKRLDAMNEFRGALKDQTDRSLSRAEYDIHHQRIVEDIRSLRESRSEIQGKASQEDVEKAKGVGNRAFTVSVISVIMVILGLIINIAFHFLAK